MTEKNKGGRPPGPGRNLQKARGMLNHLVERKAEIVEKWLDAVYEQDGPKEALKLFIDICEFCIPKLARTEMQQLDADGQPADAGFSIEIRHVRADAPKTD